MGNAQNFHHRPLATPCHVSGHAKPLVLYVAGSGVMAALLQVLHQFLCWQKPGFLHRRSLIQRNLLQEGLGQLPARGVKTIQGRGAEFPSLAIFIREMEAEGSWRTWDLPRCRRLGSASPRRLLLGLVTPWQRNPVEVEKVFKNHRFWKPRNPGHTRLCFTVLCVAFATVRKRLLNSSNVSQTQA